MNRLLVLTWLCVGALCPFTAMAQPRTSGDDRAADAQFASDSAKGAGPSASSRILQARDDYLQARGYELGASGNPGNAVIHWGIAPVTASTNSKLYLQSRITAYGKALIDAQAKLVRYMNQKVTVDRAREFFDDASEFDPRRLPGKTTEEIIRRKTQALTEAELDQKLAQLGIDPKGFEGARLADKQTMFLDAMLETTWVEAVGSIAGLRPLVTFEGKDEQGNSAIGVLTVFTENNRRLAADIARGHVHTGMTGKAPQAPLAEQIPSDTSELMKMFGVRVLIDENGDRSVVAFATQGFVSERTRQVARQQAQSMALAALAEFIGGAMDYSSKAEVGERVREFMVTSKDGFRQPERLQDFVSTFNESARVRAQESIKGVTTIRSWDGKHPEYGQDMVGVVIAWSPSSHDLAGRLGRPASTSAHDAKSSGKSKPGVKRSKELGDPADW